MRPGWSASLLSIGLPFSSRTCTVTCGRGLPTAPIWASFFTASFTGRKSAPPDSEEPQVLKILVSGSCPVRRFFCSIVREPAPISIYRNFPIIRGNASCIWERRISMEAGTATRAVQSKASRFSSISFAKAKPFCRMAVAPLYSVARSTRRAKEWLSGRGRSRRSSCVIPIPSIVLERIW